MLYKQNTHKIMENSNKSKSLFLKFLPKAASAVSFQNPQFSPGRDHHHSSKLKAHAHKGFSGPINFSVLPDEARRKSKDEGYEANEPTSPKVSCMGQIKYKHKQKKLKRIASKSNKVNNNNVASEGKKSGSSISKFFNKSNTKVDKKSKGSQIEVQIKDSKKSALDKTNKKVPPIPTLGHMKKFASGRESLANFDWTAQIAPIDHDRDYYSDDDEIRRDNSNNSDEEDDVMIPFSAPILLGGRSSLLRGEDQDVLQNLEPRKEVNLWKRRTMAPPPPLALNSKVRL